MVCDCLVVLVIVIIVITARPPPPEETAHATFGRNYGICQPIFSISFSGRLLTENLHMNVIFTVL